MTAAGFVIATCLAAIPTTSHVLDAAVSTAEVERFALVVGYNGKPSDGVQTLHFADDDALAMQRLLEDVGAHVTLLTRLDEDSERLHGQAHTAGDATLSRLREGLADLFTAMRTAAADGTATDLYVFYSGHGEVENGEGYLLLEDGHLTRRMLFEEILERSPARANHVIIDACKSSFLAFDKGAGESRRVFKGAWQGGDHSEVLARTGFLLSTSSGRDSHEWERFQSGVFSHEVRSALRGAADVNADGLIDYAELGGFLESANRGIQNLRYRPDFLVRAPGVPPGDLTLPLLAWGAHPVVWVQGGVVGHVYVETRLGERIVDLHPGKRQAIPLRLPKERPLYVRDASEAHELVLDHQGSVTIVALEAPRSTARKGALSDALDQLFTADFDRLDVDAFAANYDILHLGIAPSSPTESPVRGRVRTGAAVTAIAGVTVGSALLVWAHVLAGRDQASQADRVSINRDIDRLNTGGVISLATAGAAATLWTVLTLMHDPADGPRATD